MDIQNHNLKIYDKSFENRLILGTALYPNLDIMKDSIIESKSNLVTVSLRRESNQIKNGNFFWECIKELNVDVLPNTAGCYTAKEAILTAQMAREVFNTNLVKLEVICNSYNLQPNIPELLKATEELIQLGFKVLPYCTDDSSICAKLIELGCKVIMPLAAPIGTGKGLLNAYQFKMIREQFSEVTIIIDAGIGRPSHACQAMELGADGIMLNTAVAKSLDPIMMAKAFNFSIQAGNMAYKAKMMNEKEIASPSTPVVGKPFWHQV